MGKEKKPAAKASKVPGSRKPKTVAEASLTADAALVSAQQMTDSMTFWMEAQKKRKEQAAMRKKKGLSPAKKAAKWFENPTDELSVVSGMSKFSIDLGLDE